MVPKSAEMNLVSNVYLDSCNPDMEALIKTLSVLDYSNSDQDSLFSKLHLYYPKKGNCQSTLLHFLNS